MVDMWKENSKFLDDVSNIINLMETLGYYHRTCTSDILTAMLVAEMQELNAHLSQISAKL